VRGGVLQAVARPLHVGRTVTVVQTSMTDERGKLAAQVTQTQAVLPSAGYVRGDPTGSGRIRSWCA
jgi:acyl-coenzyme A thioesterase PaaI-like protein